MKLPDGKADDSPKQPPMFRIAMPVYNHAAYFSLPSISVYVS